MANVTKTPHLYGILVSRYSEYADRWGDNTSSTSLQIYNGSSGYSAVAYSVQINDTSGGDDEIIVGDEETSSATYSVTNASLEIRINNTSFAPSNATFQCDVYKDYPFTNDNLLQSQTYDKTDDSYPFTQRFNFSGLNATVNGIVYFVVRKTNSNSGIWTISNASASINYTLPALTLSVTPVELYAGNNVTANFTNRLGQTLTIRAYYNSTLLYETSASSDSIQITCPESWFTDHGITSNYINVKLRASDSLGRTSSDATFVLRRATGGVISPIAPRNTSKNGNEQINFSWSYTGDGTLTKTELQWSTDNAAWSDLATINSSETAVSVAAYKFKAGTVYWRARATNSFGLSGSWCNSVSFTVTFPALTVGLTPSELYVGSTITADFTNRLDQQLTVRAYYNTTLLYETTTSRDSLTITCPETWFNTAGVTSNSMTVKIRAVDNLGRTSADATFTLRIPVLTVTLNKTSVVIGDTITATLSERAGRAVTLYFATYKNNQEITLAQQVVTSDDPVTVQCERSWFTDHSQLDNDKQITVRVAAVTSSVQASVNFTLQYPALTADVSETSIKVGQRFTLNVTNGELEQLTVTMTANSRTVATTETTSAQTTIPTDASYYAQDSHSMSLTVTVTVSDKRGRTASDTFTLDANSGNMYPIVRSKQLLIVQPDSIAEEYSNTYIANVSRAKISLKIIFPSYAKAQRTVVTYDGNSMELFYNSSSDRYEATTVNPITDDTDFLITVTDQRGLTTTSTLSLTGVVEYSAPSVSILNYHRCNEDHTANDSGAYCEMTVEYTISSINDTNAGTASVTSSIYTDSQTLQTYTQQVVYFFAADIEHSYDITVSLADKILTETRTVRLSTAGVIMDFLAGGKGIGLGKVAETQRMVEVNPEWTLQSANIRVKVGDNMVDLGTLLSTILDRLS